MRLRDEQELGHLGLKVDSAPKRTCGRVEVANAQRGAAQREPDVALQAVEGQTPGRQALQHAALLLETVDALCIQGVFHRTALLLEPLGAAQK